MRILVLSSQAPAINSGGGIAVLQTIKSLALVAEVDYIGPDYDLQLPIAKKLTLRSLSPVNFSSFKIHFQTSFYQSWCSQIANIEWEKYDLVWVEFSKWSFFVTEAKKHGKRVVVRLHNIERDYYWNSFVHSPSLRKLSQYVFYRNSEKKVVKLSDRFIVLTEKDRKRLCTLYDIQSGNTVVVPIGLEELPRDKRSTIEAAKKGRTPSLLLTGSFAYGANVRAATWFLDKVWKSSFSGNKLVIAGSKPPKNLVKKVARKDNVTLVANPNSMTEMFMEASIFVAPIFDGAGMKVKVAEALRSGLVVVGTEHALVGYERNERVLIEANTPYQFSERISELLNLTRDDLETRSKIASELFVTKYSINSTASVYKKELLNWIE